MHRFLSTGLKEKSSAVMKPSPVGAQTMEAQYFDSLLSEIARAPAPPSDPHRPLRTPKLFKDLARRFLKIHPRSFHWINEASLRARATEVLDQQQKKAALDTLPRVEQRSEEWYRERDTMLTASDWGQALGVGKFGTVRNLYEKKCNYGDEKPFDDKCPPLAHGQLFEPVATEIYQMRYGCKVDEYGLVRHPEYPFLGASPDGINELGVMLEIKCPYMREITGAIVDQYYYQIQGQLEVCNLEYCDFMECAFDKAFTLDELREIESDYKGIILVDENDRKIYGRVNDLDSLADAALACKTTHYYFLTHLNVKRVKRDRAWFRRNLAGLREVWDNVLRYRANREAYELEVRNAPKRSPKATKASAKPSYDHTVPMFRDASNDALTDAGARAPTRYDHTVPMFR